MSRNRVLTVGVCLVAVPTLAFADERLSLADATTRALAKNHAVRIERENISAADARALSARGYYDVQMRVDLNGRYHRDPVNSLFTGAPEGQAGASQSSWGSSVTLSQLFKTGAVASASTSVAREGTDGIFSPFAPAYTTSLGVDLQQPLLRNRATDSARTALRVTALDHDRSSAALARQALETVAGVEKAYWALVAARREAEVRGDNLALAERFRRETEVRIEARIAAASDLAQPTAEVERRRGDLFAAQETVSRAERTLKLLIAGDLNDPIWGAVLTPTDAPDSAPLAVDLARALADAARNRPEINELAVETSQQDLEVVLARDSMMPRLDLVAGYTIRGLAGDRDITGNPFGSSPISIPRSLSGGFGDSWANLVDGKFPDATVGVVFELPLGNRDARGRIGRAEAERRRSGAKLAATHEKIATEVLNAVTALETAEKRIAAARAGLAAADTQLRAEQDRFSVGLSTNFFVLTRQNDLALAQLAEIAALTDYRKAETELGRATGTLLRERNIGIE